MRDTHNTLDFQWLQRALVIAVLDVLCIAASFFFALWIRFDFQIGWIPMEYLEGYLHSIWVWIGVSIVVFWLFKMYNSIWLYVSVDELARMPSLR